MTCGRIIQIGEARMSNLAGGEAVGGARAPEHGDAYLSHWSAQAEQRRWLLPPDGGWRRLVARPQPMCA